MPMRQRPRHPAPRYGPDGRRADAPPPHHSYRPPADTAAELALEADLLVCLSQPVRFHALRYYYANFPQLSDSEVLDIMALAAQARGAGRNANDRRRSAAHAANKSRPIAGS